MAAEAISLCGLLWVKYNPMTLLWQWGWRVIPLGPVDLGCCQREAKGHWHLHLNSHYQELYESNAQPGHYMKMCW